MRIKTLINIHGARVTFVHWSDWERRRAQLMEQSWCVVLLEGSVPDAIKIDIILQTEPIPLFLITSQLNKIPTHQQDSEREINVLLPSLSSSEIVSVLEPYWTEDFALILPNTLVVDDEQSSADLLSRYLSKNLLTFQVHNELKNLPYSHFDMVVAHLKPDININEFLAEIRYSLPHAGLMVFGLESTLGEFSVIQSLINYKVDAVFSTNELNNDWYGKFSTVWQGKLIERENRIITKRMQASVEKLLQKNLIMQVLFSTADDGVVAFDELGNIGKVNDGFADMVGSNTGAIHNQNLLDWVSKSTKPKLVSVLQSSDWQQQINIELELMHEQHIGILVLASINRINTKDGKIYIAVMRNVTSQQLQTKILSHKNTELEHRANRAVNERNLIKELDIKASRKQNRFMQLLMQYLIDNASQLEPRLLNKLSNLSLLHKVKDKREAFKPEPLNLAEQIHFVTQALVPSAVHTAANHIHCDISHEITVSMTRPHLHKVLLEVISNAIEYADSNNDVTISMVGMVDKFVEISISDTGPGMEELAQVNAFDIFDSNALNQQSGIVTGLPLCSALMHLNMGEIYIDNHVRSGQILGARILLKLPRS